MKYFVVATEKNGFFNEETDYYSIISIVSFRGHQSQTIECIKALHDIYNCILIIFLEKGLEILQKIFRIFVDSLLLL